MARHPQGNAPEQAEHLVVAEPLQCFVVTSLSSDQVMELLELREELEVFALKKTLASPVMKLRIQSAPALLQRRREVLKEHAKLIASLEAGDEEALEQAMRYHVRATRQHLQKSLVDAGPAEAESAGLL